MSLDIQKVLVTGANGFVGRELVNELQNNGTFEVCGLIGRTSKMNFGEKIHSKNIFNVDISDHSTLARVEKDLKNTGTVIHTAGLAHQFGRITKEDFWNVNVKGTENVCRLALEIGAKHFILISSVSVYGDHGNAEIDEWCECRPKGFYAESKLESEARADDFCRAKDICLTILRPATIIGEGDRGNTARLIELIDKNRFLWIGNGDNKKSLIYKTDVARGILKTILMQRDDGTEIYNLTSETVSMKEIVFEVARNLQKKTSRLKIPENLIRGLFRLNRLPFSFEYLRKFETTFEKWLSDDIFSGNKFNRRYHFKPETKFTEALAKQVNYYLKYQK